MLSFVPIQGKAGEPVKMKDEKESKPASMRVRDAAESLLNNILEQVKHFIVKKGEPLIGPCLVISFPGGLFPVSLRRRVSVVSFGRSVFVKALQFLAGRGHRQAYRLPKVQVLRRGQQHSFGFVGGTFRKRSRYAFQVI